jgi:glyoxylase-like metal-dependent hydrolase (beta-lactamase superfamily II)
MTAVPVQRWRIGDVEITRVVESETPIPTGFMFGDQKLEILEQASWLTPYYVTPDRRLVTSIHAFVIDDGDHKIVVDTCVGNDKVRRMPFWNRLQLPFLSHLEELGHPAESVDRVLCTHLHVDHVGWNTRWVDGRWVPTFPNARYLIGRTEWEHWSAEPPDPGEDILGDSVRPIVEAGLADLVESDHRVSPAVWLESTPGHTPGHVSVRIRSQGAEAVITGDLMHHPLQIADPDTATTFDSDTDRARRTRKEFVARYTDAPVLVLGTHFATPSGGRIVRERGVLRLVPPDPA